MAVTHDIVAKLWNLCNILRDDGVTYQQYVTELTYLLFLKMAEETEQEEKLPKGYRWQDLIKKPAPDRLEHYRIMLIHLGTKGSRQVQEIFANAYLLLTLLQIKAIQKKMPDQYLRKKHEQFHRKEKQFD